jgi:hypothetical protein
VPSDHVNKLVLPADSCESVLLRCFHCSRNIAADSEILEASAEQASRDVTGLGIEFGLEGAAATSRFPRLTKLTKPVGKMLDLFKRPRALSFGATSTQMRIRQRSGPSSTKEFRELCATLDEGAIFGFHRQLDTTRAIQILPETRA